MATSAARMSRYISRAAALKERSMMRSSSSRTSDGVHDRVQQGDRLLKSRLQLLGVLQCHLRHNCDHGGWIRFIRAPETRHSAGVIVVLKLGSCDHAAQDGKAGPVPRGCHQATCLIQGPKNRHDFFPACLGRSPLADERNPVSCGFTTRRDMAREVTAVEKQHEIRVFHLKVPTANESLDSNSRPK